MERSMTQELQEFSVVEFNDEVTTGLWQRYSESGLPELIGGMHLCHVLRALWQTGITRMLAEGEWVERSRLIGELDPHVCGHLLRYLAILGVTEEGDGRVRATQRSPWRSSAFIWKRTGR
jgi:hypothetical protein